MDHSIVPIEWKKFLSTVQTLFPDAVIAGGALRDLIVEKQVKDVDIFVSDMDMNVNIIENGQLQKLAETLGIVYLNEDEESDRDFVRVDNDFKQVKTDIFDRNVKAAIKSSEYMDGDDQRSIYESFINYIVTVKYNSVLYQLIFIEAPTKQYVYNDFDFGICKIFFDGNKLTVTEEFWYDLENKQITFAGKFSTGQAIHTLFVHRENMVKKFPGWKVVIDDLKKRGPDEMPPSYRNMTERVAKEVERAIEREKAKVVITTSQVNEDGNGVYYDANSGMYIDSKSGDMFVQGADGKKIRLVDFANKWQTPDDPYEVKNLWDQHALKPQNPWIDTDSVYQNLKEAERKAMMETRIKVDMSQYFGDIEKAKMMGMSIDEYYEIRESLEREAFD